MHEKPHPGESIVFWDEPDTCVTRFVGDVNADEMRRVTRETSGLTFDKPYYILLIDLAHVRSFSADARKAALERGADSRCRGTVIFGASPHFRILASLVGRAVDLFHKPIDHQRRFFDTEAEARAWTAEHRKQIAAGRPA